MSRLVKLAIPALVLVGLAGVSLTLLQATSKGGSKDEIANLATGSIAALDVSNRGETVSTAAFDGPDGEKVMLADFEGRNILHLPHELDAVSRSEKITRKQLEETLKYQRGILLEKRDSREPPFRDEKILVPKSYEIDERTSGVDFERERREFTRWTKYHAHHGRRRSTFRTVHFVSSRANGQGSQSFDTAAERV